jgi:hypothetical protein
MDVFANAIYGSIQNIRKYEDMRLNPQPVILLTTVAKNNPFDPFTLNPPCWQKVSR